MNVSNVNKRGRNSVDERGPARFERPSVFGSGAPSEVRKAGGARGPVRDLKRSSYAGRRPEAVDDRPYSAVVSSDPVRRSARVRVSGDLYHPVVPPGAIYVGRQGFGLRRSPWANPYGARAHGRSEALRLYRQWLCD